MEQIGGGDWGVEFSIRVCNSIPTIHYQLFKVTLFVNFVVVSFDFSF